MPYQLVAAVVAIGIEMSLTGSYHHGSVRCMVMLVLLLLSLTTPPRGGMKTRRQPARRRRRLSAVGVCVAVLLAIGSVPAHAQALAELLSRALFGAAEADSGMTRVLRPTERPFDYHRRDSASCDRLDAASTSPCYDFFKATGASGDVLDRLHEAEGNRLLGGFLDAEDQRLLDSLREARAKRERLFISHRPASFFHPVSFIANTSDPGRFEIYRSAYPSDAMTKATSGNAWQGSLSDAELGAIVMRMCEGDQESLTVMRVLMGRLAARKVRPSTFGSTATPENLQSGIWLAACDGNNVDMRGAFKWLTSIPVGEVGENMSRAASSGKDKAQSSKVSSLSQDGDWDLSEILPSKEPGPEDIAAGNDLVLGMLGDFDWHGNGWKKWQTIVLAANGYTAKEGSYVFGVSQRTWYRWLDEIRTDFTEKAPQLGVTLRLRNNDMISKQPGS